MAWEEWGGDTGRSAPRPQARMWATRRGVVSWLRAYTFPSPPSALPPSNPPKGTFPFWNLSPPQPLTTPSGKGQGQLGRTRSPGPRGCLQPCCGGAQNPHPSLGPLRAMLLSSAPNTREPEKNEVSFYARLHNPLLPSVQFSSIQFISF